MTIPIIDERIKHVGPATLRKFDALKLRGLRDLIVIQDGDEPLAVLIPYEMYLEMQKEVVDGKKAIDRSIFHPGFQADGPVDVLPKLNPDDYGKMPAGVPVAIDDGTEPNGGASQNPDMAYSKGAYIEPSRERREVPRSGSTMDLPTPIDQIHDKDSDFLPPAAPDLKDIVVPYNEIPIDYIPPPRCHHCGKEGPRLCQECFIAGHRAVANCQQCAER